MNNVHINNAKRLVKVHAELVREGTAPGPIMEALDCGRDLYIDAKLKSLERETLENTIALLFGLLYPHDDVDGEWSPDTLDDVADLVLNALDLKGVF